MEDVGAKAMARVPRARGQGIPWTAIATLVLAALGVLFAVSRGRLDGVDSLAIRARLERGEVVALERLPRRVAARFAHGWGGVPVERVDTSASVAVVVRSLEPDAKGALERLAAAGVELHGDEWSHRATGVSIAAAGASAAVAAPRDGELEVALIRSGGLEGDVAAALAAALAAAPLPTGRRLWLFDGARLVLEDWPGGADVAAHDPPSAAEIPAAERLGAAALPAALARISARFHLDGIPARPTPSLRWIAARAKGLTAPAAAGWFDGAANELVVAAGVRGGIEDALRSFVTERILDAFGAPKDPWLLEGYAAWLAVDGDGDAPGSSAVVTGERAAPREARRAERRRAVRALLEGGDARLIDLVRDGVPPGALATVIAEAGGELSPAAARPGALDPGAFVRYGGSIRAARRVFGSARGEAELERIAALGFDGVLIEVHVPAPPRSSARAGSRPRPAVVAGGQEWGMSSTLEGDGAVLMAAAQARRAGLRVVLAPKLVASPSGPFVGQQVAANSPESLGRLAVALAGAAELAARAGAEGLVVLDTFHFPADAALREKLPASDRAARDAAFDGLLAAAASFPGALLAISNSTEALDRMTRRGGLAAEVIRGVDRFPASTSPGGKVRAADAGLVQVTIHGTDRALDGPNGWGGAEDETLRTELLEALAAALTRDESIPVVVLRGWIPGGDGAVDTDLSDASEEALRAVARTR